MSDCQSSFGCARSKRRWGCSRAGVASRSSSRPSSWRIRRTVLSATPRAANRRSTSAIRRVPYSGWSSFSAVTASRIGSGAFGRTGGTIGFGTSASNPPSRYRFTQSLIVVTASPNTRATSAIGAPSSTISRTTRSRSSTGCVLGFPGGRPRPLGPPLPAPLRLVLSCLRIRLPFRADCVSRNGRTVLSDSEPAQALIRWRAAQLSREQARPSGRMHLVERAAVHRAAVVPHRRAGKRARADHGSHSESCPGGGDSRLRSLG